MKTSKEITEEQTNIEQDIYDLAATTGLSNDNWLPITDGTASPEQYLNAKYQIMCVLKEPYDEVSEDEIPSGGGWSIVNDCFQGHGLNGLEPKDNVWSQASWQPLIYFLYALFHNMHWEDLDWLRDNPTMAKVLQKIVYLNVNKMPALTQSNNNDMVMHYATWKPILFRQFKLYEPSVIVFHGTYNLFADDLSSILGFPITLIQTLEINEVYYGSVYRCGEKLLIAVDHPNCRKKGFNRGDYVNLLIDTIQKYARKIY